MWSATPKKWAEHLSAYPNGIQALETTHNKTDLSALETFVWTELPPKMRARKSPHITAIEYARVVRWKLKRGKFRPRLQTYADSADNAEVIEYSKKAFAALKKGKLNDAIKSLVQLKGCGPATASAVLAAFDENVPFMSDELLQEAMGERKYTASAYMQLSEKVKEKTAQLCKADKSHPWTTRDIERAVFAAQHANKESPSDLIERPSYATQAKAAATKTKKGSKKTPPEPSNATPTKSKKVTTPKGSPDPNGVQPPKTKTTKKPASNPNMSGTKTRNAKPRTSARGTKRASLTATDSDKPQLKRTRLSAEKKSEVVETTKAGKQAVETEEEKKGTKTDKDKVGVGRRTRSNKMLAK